MKAVVFDIDGVLIDSNEIIVEAYRKTAEKLRLRIPLSQEVNDLMGRPLTEIVRILWGNTDVGLYTREYRRLFTDDDLVIPAIEGAVDAVSEIKESGFRIGAISGKIMFFIRKHLEEAGFDINWFEAISSFEATERHKPNPEPLLYVADTLDVKLQEMVYVGDAIPDYECAKNAKVKFVTVLTGALQREDVDMLEIENVIGSVTELPDLLTKGLI